MSDVADLTVKVLGESSFVLEQARIWIPALITLIAAWLAVTSAVKVFARQQWWAKKSEAYLEYMEHLFNTVQIFHTFYTHAATEVELRKSATYQSGSNHSEMNNSYHASKGLITKLQTDALRYVPLFSTDAFKLISSHWDTLRSSNFDDYYKRGEYEKLCEELLFVSSKINTLRFKLNKEMKRDLGLEDRGFGFQIKKYFQKLLSE